MIEKFKTYFERLERLSSEDLDRSAENPVRREKQSVALLIAHIAEISRRKVDLDRGYRNTFDYCVRRLNLSEGSVALRLQVANVSRRFPQILVALSENRISLTVGGLLAPHLTEDNVEKLLSDCAGMTKRAVEEYLVAIRPKPVFAPSIRRQPVAPANREPVVLPISEEARPVAEAPMPVQAPVRSTPPVLEPARPDQFNFRFSADRKFKEKFERLAEVLGVENALGHMAEVLERALDAALDQRDPKRRLERRLAKKQEEAQAKRNLVRTRFLEKPPGMFPARSSSASTRGEVIDASIECQTALDALLGQASKSNMRRHSRSSAATRSEYSSFCALATTVSGPSSSMGPRSFRRGLTKPGARECERSQLWMC